MRVGVAYEAGGRLSKLASAERQAEEIEGAAHPESAPVENVRVDHGRADVPVTEQFLNRANIITSLEQVRRERVTLMPSSA